MALALAALNLLGCSTSVISLAEMPPHAVPQLRSDAVAPRAAELRGERVPRVSASVDRQRRGPYRVSGRIVTAGGEPIRAAELWLAPVQVSDSYLRGGRRSRAIAATFGAVRFSTDSHGRFAASLPGISDTVAPRWVMLVRGEGLQPGWCYGALREFEDITLCVRRGRLVTGRVVDEDGELIIPTAVTDLETGERVLMADANGFELRQCLDAATLLTVEPARFGVTHMNSVSMRTPLIRKVVTVPASDTGSSVDLGDVVYAIESRTRLTRPKLRYDHEPFWHRSEVVLSGHVLVSGAPIDEFVRVEGSNPELSGFATLRDREVCVRLTSAALSGGEASVQFLPTGSISIRFVESDSAVPIPVRKAAMTVRNGAGETLTVRRFNDPVGRYRVSWQVPLCELGEIWLSFVAGDRDLGEIRVNLDVDETIAISVFAGANRTGAPKLR